MITAGYRCKAESLIEGFKKGDPSYSSDLLEAAQLPHT